MDLPPEENSFLNMLGLPFSSKLDDASFIVSVAKIIFNQIGALILTMKFPPSEVLFISIELLYDLVQNAAVMSVLVLLAAT